MTATPPTERTRVRRLPERGRYERDVINAIIDEALICHVGFVADGQPFVIPTIHARVDDVLYLHGSPASRLLRAARDGARLCVTITLLDGLVMARSAFHHSMNYRSVVVLAEGADVTDVEEKLVAMRAVVEHVARGRWEAARQPNDTEIRTTRIVRLPLDEASAKVRTGPPKDDEEDMGLDVWAGELPLITRPGTPVPRSRSAGRRQLARAHHRLESLRRAPPRAAGPHRRPPRGRGGG